MTIEALTIHHLAGTADTAATITLGTAALPLDERAIALVDALKSSFFSRLTREHGSFTSEGDASPLALGLDAYADAKLDFAALNSGLMTQWQTLLGQDPVAVDAHLVCWAEQRDEARAFYLVAAGAKSAFGVSEDLTIESRPHLDLGPGLFGIKVDLHEWRTTGHYAYLSCVAPRGNRVLADSFAVLTGFTPGLDKADTTEAFLAGVEAFAKQVDPAQVERYRHQVVHYCAEQEQRDAPIDLADLARSVEGVDTEHFSRFMADYAPQDDSALRMDRRSLRRYVKFAGREKDLAISFSSSQLNNRVHYDPDKDTLSIDGIPRTLREQLLKHLNG